MAATLKNCAIFYTLIYLCGFLSLETLSVPTYLGYYCTENGTYASNSSFRGNLNALLNSLVTNTTQAKGYYTVMGYGTANQINPVNGLFNCRLDLNTSSCQQCVAAAAAEITQRCPNQTEAIIWYEECLLRYTGRFFRYYSIVPGMNLVDGKNISGNDLKEFNQTLFSLLNDIAVQTTNSQTPIKFATGEARFGGNQTLYGMGQCTTEIQSAQCETCLKNAIGTFPTCCNGAGGARALLASCVIRYELYPFYNSSSSLLNSSGKKKLSSGATILIVVLVGASVVLLGFVSFLLRRRARRKQRNILKENFGEELATLESLQFSLASIEAATNRFSQEKKIGRGGFGEVYKGTLLDGREIAVKKLSRSSGQGAMEFKTEILLIAKLQHRNLVALLGFCLEGEEKMLIYEYVPNKSLDHFLFDPKKKRVLNWYERYKIIGGIARGIHYLHEHSRLKIIHRDLKPSNVLLDDNMNPKISDFGMARIIAIDQDQINTNRIVGTYGYMSPEYAMHGQFSEKSDVFSFGVIVLEIVSARRNARPIETQDLDDLANQAWKHWRNQTPLEIVDPEIKDSFSQSEVIKCIQIGLLCVQENPENRPTMARIVSYLSSLLAELPSPQEPAFHTDTDLNLNLVSWESSTEIDHLSNYQRLRKMEYIANPERRLNGHQAQFPLIMTRSRPFSKRTDRTECEARRPVN
ncbi:hypothetical protein K1719_000673 [Acacia pycnantha]|nr:hypothetical protein K1719_000673 [Acacia pycnantha]